MKMKKRGEKKEEDDRRNWRKTNKEVEEWKWTWRKKIAVQQKEEKKRKTKVEEGRRIETLKGERKRKRWERGLKGGGEGRRQSEHRL